MLKLWFETGNDRLIVCLTSGRFLREIADKIEAAGVDCVVAIFDANGNRIGELTLETDD